MILCVRNTLCLALVVLTASACGMMREEGATASSAPAWFQYAYYSSEATLEADGMSKEVLDYNKARMRVY